MTFSIQLRSGECCRLSDSNLDQIVVERGTVWVTFAGVKSDLVVPEGKPIPRLGRGALVSALSEGAVLRAPRRI